MYEIIKKCWGLNLENVDESYFFEEKTFLGTRGQAKNHFLDYLSSSGAIDNMGNNFNFMSIKVHREKSGDIVDFDGIHISRWQIEERKRISHLLNSIQKDKIYYVQDNRSYVGNAVLWWGKNGNGYVTDLEKAHKFTYDELLKFNPRSSDIVWDSEHVEKAVRNYVDGQYLDHKKAL